MNNLGYMYNFGDGIVKNFMIAMEWYHKAVKLGNTTAISNIAYMYEQGCGVVLKYYPKLYIGLDGQLKKVILML